MGRCIVFELAKVWGRRRFIVSAAAIFLLNVFVLWYTNLSDGMEPELSAYKALERDIADMSETEKQDYIEKLHEDIQGVSVVRDILMFQKMSGEMGEALAEQEIVFINEIYEEMTKVCAYPEYLDHIQDNKSNLSGISIFADETGDSFSSRNIAKSAADYSGLSGVTITFFPSKGIAGAMKNSYSDVLLILSVFLFGGSLMDEEKEKRLFLITRATVFGRGRSIEAKLTALAIHCMLASGLIYGSNLFYFAWTTGLGNLSRSIQSVAPFMESCCRFSVLTFILLSVLTKGAVLFVIGCVIVIVSIISKQSFVPWLTVGAVLAGNLILYQCIPAWSVFNWLKYLNIIGLLRTENIYGSYLNFNFGGWPIDRTLASAGILLLFVNIGIAAAILLFLSCGNFEWKKAGELRLPFVSDMAIHSNLFRHEGYKIFMMNHAALVLIIFAVLLGYQRLSAQYYLSIKEAYYQNMMLQLEGPLTLEKEALIAGERERYESAFAQIERIDQMAAEGELDERTAESMKTPYDSEAAFYPAFQRVLMQYEWIQENGGSFIYDTGYLYLFGVIDDGYLMDFILLTVCFILAFSHTMMVEYEKGLWPLLSATARGKKMIIRRKVVACLLAAGPVSLVPWVCRAIRLHQTYPLHGMMTPIHVMPDFCQVGPDIPVLLVLLAAGSLWFLAACVTAGVVLILSWRLKSHLQVIFTSVLVLLIPLLLKMMLF